LLSVGESEIVLEEQKVNPNGKAKQNKGKKTELVQHIIALETIKTTKIQINVPPAKPGDFFYGYKSFHTRV